MVKVGNPPIAGQVEIFPENHEKPGGLNAGLKKCGESTGKWQF